MKLEQKVYNKLKQNTINTTNVVHHITNTNKTNGIIIPSSHNNNIYPIAITDPSTVAVGVYSTSLSNVTSASSSA